jgi:hypothetical protein
LRTINQFIHEDFQLGELDELTHLEGMRFRDLLPSRQRKIKNRSIRGIVLNEHADDQARFDLFDRINTGSKIANKAEVRRGALVGPFLDLVIALAEDPSFVRLAPVSDAYNKLREREELVTRFFAYGDGLDGYEDKVSSFLFEYAKKMNQLFTDDPGMIPVYRERFMDVVRFVQANFPWGFRRTKNGTATPRARFEAIAIGSYLAIQADPRIASRKHDVREWLSSEDFKNVTGADGANAIARLKARINFVRDHLLGA